MTSPIFDRIPERRENQAEAEFKGGAQSIIALRAAHVMIADDAATCISIVDPMRKASSAMKGQWL